MDNEIETPTARWTARHISPNEHISVLTKHFGRYLKNVDETVRETARRLCPEVSRENWQIFELPNGAIYMAPPTDTFQIEIAENTFKGTLTADALGIAACLLTYGHLAFRLDEAMFTEHYDLLRDLVPLHRESQSILCATD